MRISSDLFNAFLKCPTKCWLRAAGGPVKPATISGWQDALKAWLLPNLGDKQLSDVSNGAVRELVEKMSGAGLAAKTIVNYVQVVKLVVASVVDSESEQVYPRKWNHDFILFGSAAALRVWTLTEASWLRSLINSHRD